jgi:hypothetical protein
MILSPLETPLTPRKSFHPLTALVLAAALSGCGMEPEGATPSDPPTTARGEDGLARKTNPNCSPLCAGDCTPVLIGQKSGLDRPIVAVGPHVYFSGALTYEAPYSFFGRASKQDGSLSLLAQNINRPPSFVSNGTSAYVIVDSNNAGFAPLSELRPDGSITPVPNIDGRPDVFTIYAVDASRFYGWSSHDNSVWSAPTTGGSWSRFSRSLPDEAGRSVHVDANNVYVVTDDVGKKQSSVWRISKRSSLTAKRLLTLPGSIVSLTQDDTDLYFANRTGGLFRASKSDGAVTQLASTAAEMSIALDGEHYYWFNGNALTATCKNGSASQVLATVSAPKTGIPDILEVDAEGLYWRNYSQVWKIAK